MEKKVKEKTYVEPMYKIVSDKEARTITVGSLVLTEFSMKEHYPFDNYEAETTFYKDFIKKYPDISSFKKKGKEKTIGRKAVIYGPKYGKRLQQAMYDVFIRDYEPLIGELCREKRTRRFNEVKVKCFFERLDLINQCELNGQKSIIPLAFFFNKDAKKLRALFGKGLWKSLLKNSFYKNKLIVNQLEFREDFTLGANAIKETISILNSFKSSSLVFQMPFERNYFKSTFSLDINLSSYINRLKTSTLKSSDIILEKNIYEDTKRMLEDCDRADYFNPKWSNKRMHREHDRISEYITNKKLLQAKKANEPYDDIFNKYLSKIDLDTKEYSVKHLGRLKDYVLEGTRMNHCVAGYSDIALKGEYVAFHVVHNQTGEESTLGLKISINSQVLDIWPSNVQWLGRYNKRDIIKSEQLIQSIVTKLRKEIPEEEKLEYLENKNKFPFETNFELHDLAEELPF